MRYDQLPSVRVMFSDHANGTAYQFVSNRATAPAPCPLPKPASSTSAKLSAPACPNLARLARIASLST